MGCNVSLYRFSSKVLTQFFWFKSRELLIYNFMNPFVVVQSPEFKLDRGTEPEFQILILKYFINYCYNFSVEEQLDECLSGKCVAFDRDRPRVTSIVWEEWNRGCVLLSRWIPEEIQRCASAKSCAGLDQRCGSMDFTYSSAKVKNERSTSLWKSKRLFQNGRGRCLSSELKGLHSRQWVLNVDLVNWDPP